MKKKLTPEDIKNIIKENWGKIPFEEIGKICGLSKDAVRGRGKRMHLPSLGNANKLYAKEVAPEVLVQKDREKLSYVKEKQINSQKIKLLIDENDKLKTELEASLQIKQAINPFEFDYTISDNQSEATAVVLASDFHLEETVRPETVNGLNKFDLKIAERRVQEFFQNTLKLVQKEQHSTKINTLVLCCSF